MPDRLTDEQLQEIEARCATAPGSHWLTPVSVTAILGKYTSTESKDIHRFLFHALVDIPALIAEVKSLKQEREPALESSSAVQDLDSTIQELVAAEEIEDLKQGRDRLSQAIKFLPHEDEQTGKRIYIDKCVSDNRGTQWAVRDGFGRVLLINGRWRDEPMPSSRTDEFLAVARFNTLDEAYAAVAEKVKGEKQHA